MTQPITAKSPSEILAEFENPLYLINKDGAFNMENDEVWLRSSLASVLLWASEELPKEETETKDEVVCSGCSEHICDYGWHTNLDGFSRCCGKKRIRKQSEPYPVSSETNTAISDCRQKLIELAHSIEE